MTERPNRAKTPPAVKLRRALRIRLLSLISLMLLFVGSALVIDHYGVFRHTAAQVIFAAVFAGSILALGLWKSRAPCPNCGWNIRFRKTSFPMVAAQVPSVCPNCGLDLEKYRP